MLTRREKEALGALITGVVVFGGFGVGTAIEYCNDEKKLEQTITEEVGFNIVDVQDAKLSQTNEDFKAIIQCTHKETNMPIVIEYKLTSTDFIIMNQPESNPWDYLLTYIIPHQDPSYVGTQSDYNNTFESFQFSQNLDLGNAGEYSQEDIYLK